MIKVFVRAASSELAVAFVCFLCMGICKAAPISEVNPVSQLRETAIGTSNLELKDANRAHSRSTKATVIIPHYIVNWRTKLSTMIQGNHGQAVDGMTMYLHGQRVTKREVLSSGAIRFHFDLASIWEIKDNVTKIELNFMIHHSGEDSLKVAVKFCKITQYICDPVATVVTPSTVDGYSVVTVLVTSLALSPPDNSILTFTVKTNGNVIESTVSEFICEPLLLVCSTSIPSAAPSFRTRKQKRSVASTLQGGNDSYDHVLTEGEEHHAIKRLTTTCLLSSHVVKFAELGISNVASPTSLDIQKCSGGCAVENTYSNNGVKHTELMALDGGTYVSCSPLTYGADVVIYSNPDGSFSIVVEENIKALSCGCR